MLIYGWSAMGEQTAMPFNFIWLLEDLTFPMLTHIRACFSIWSFTPDGSDDSHYRHTLRRPTIASWYWISTRVDCYLITKSVQPHHHHHHLLRSKVVVIAHMGECLRSQITQACMIDGIIAMWKQFYHFCWTKLTLALDRDLPAKLHPFKVACPLDVPEASELAGR